jgi:hypothetical protein
MTPGRAGLPAMRPRHRRVLVALGVALVCIGVAAAVLPLRSFAEPSGNPPSGTRSPSAAAGPAPMAFGVLGSDCDPDRAAALHHAGVRYAEMGVDWSAFEPRQGSFDQDYRSTVRRAVQACRHAGIGVVLSLGLNSAPSWVSGLANGAYVDQDGVLGSTDVPNVVFSAAVRAAAGDYLAELNRTVGLNSVAAVRVGTGVNGELGYPDGSTPTTNPYWAFDAAAQQGRGRADGMSVSPMPGWTPGSATWRGAAVSTGDVQTWFRWYSTSLADAVVWVVRQLRTLGFTHAIHLPLAGRGALPADLGAALAAHLDGTDERDGSLRAGLYYPDQLQRIAQELARTERPGWGTVSVDTSSVDDSTAVSARRLDPPQDRCQAGDASVDVRSDPDVGHWSSFRWTVANARTAGFAVVGENPGSPDLPNTGGDADTDSSRQQMVHAPKYAQECGMTLFQWAFEDDLFSEDGAGLRAYAQQQQQALAARPPEEAAGPGGTGDGG